MKTKYSQTLSSFKYHHSSHEHLPPFKRKVFEHPVKQSHLRIKLQEPEQQFIEELKSVEFRPKQKQTPKLTIQRKSLTLTKVSFSPRNQQKKFQLVQESQDKQEKKPILNFKSRKLNSLKKQEFKKGKGNIICLRYKKVDMEKFLMSDLEVLRKFPQIDMQAYVVKIKKEEFHRKKESVRKWEKFKYQNLPF